MKRAASQSAPPPGHGTRGHVSERLRIVLLVLASLLFPVAARAQTARPAEYRVKAVYLYDFARFVQWPAPAANPKPVFPICVLGRDPFGSDLETVITGGSISGQRLVEKHIQRTSEASDCRILFISASEDNRLRGILAGLRSTPLLTVSDMPDFCARGGMIQFILQDHRVRFEVNLAAAAKARLTLSSQLLKVAAAVEGPAPPREKH